MLGGETFGEVVPQVLCGGKNVMFKPVLHETDNGGTDVAIMMVRVLGIIMKSVVCYQRHKEARDKQSSHNFLS